MRLPRLAGRLVLSNRHFGVIDRAEVANEGAPRDAQTDLGVLPGTIEFLGFENVPHGVADRNELSDDADVFFRDAIGAAATPDLHGGRQTIDIRTAPSTLVDRFKVSTPSPVIGSWEDVDHALGQLNGRYAYQVSKISDGRCDMIAGSNTDVSMPLASILSWRGKPALSQRES